MNFFSLYNYWHLVLVVSSDQIFLDIRLFTGPWSPGLDTTNVYTIVHNPWWELDNTPFMSNFVKPGQEV